MKRVLAAAGAILVLAWISWPGTAQIVNGVTNGPGNCSGIGTGICNPTGVQFFVATSGSDANPGTQASPWQTLTNVNSHTFGAGDCVNFNGGNTFGGGTTGINSTTLHCITSYGAGQATISTGNSAACVTATNIPAVTISNIVCTGGSDTVSTTAGISIVNSQAGNTTLAGPTITGVTVSQYGGNGIEVKGATGNSGFNGISITTSTVHDVTGNVTAADTSCIYVYSSSSGLGHNVHSNVTISGNTVSNCIGKSGSALWVGSGITLGETSTATIQKNIAHDFGTNNSNCGGPVGIWSYDSTLITIQFNEAYNGSQAGGGCDSDGFDFDVGMTNSTMQYNYGHNNAGACILVDSATGSTWSNNVVRFNICQNNATSSSYGEFTINPQTSSTMTNLQMYNNTCITDVANNTCVMETSGGNGAISGGTVANNIFFSVFQGGNVVNMPVPGTIVFNGNDYYNSQGAIHVSWNGTNYTTFAAFQSGATQESSGVSRNPLLVVYGGGGTTGGYVPASLSQYQLISGSPMIGAGLNLTSVYGINPGTQDYFGIAVTAAALPIGAGQLVTWTSGTGTCTQATSWFARATGMDTVHQERDNALICGLVADGVWSGFDAVYKLGADTLAHAELSMVSSSFTLVSHGACTFTANTGIACDGSTGYFDTQFTPSTAAGNFVQNSAEMLIYELTNRSASQNWCDLGSDSALIQDDIFPLVGGVFFGVINDNTGLFPAGTNAQGFWMLNRTGASAYTAYLNSVSFGTGTAASIAVSTFSFAVGALNDKGTVDDFSTDQMSHVAFGASQSSSQQALTAFRFNTDAIALGINTF